jgi:hypothetical protein
MLWIEQLAFHSMLALSADSCERRTQAPVSSDHAHRIRNAIELI